jgi:hypothetical protein
MEHVEHRYEENDLLKCEDVFELLPTHRGFANVCPRCSEQSPEERERQLADAELQRCYLLTNESCSRFRAASIILRKSTAIALILNNSSAVKLFTTVFSASENTDLSLSLIRAIGQNSFD